MRYHRFKIHQTVVPSTSSLPAGRYTILRLLPPVHDEPHYRVISKDDGCVRAVLEGEIRLPDLHAERLARQYRRGIDEPPRRFVTTVHRRYRDAHMHVLAAVKNRG